MYKPKIFDHLIKAYIPTLRCLLQSLEGSLELAYLLASLGSTKPVGVLGTGVPRLACMQPAAWLKWWSSTTHLHQHKTQGPCEGPSLAWQTTQGFLRTASLGRLVRRRRDQGRVPREVLVTQAMTIETRRAPDCAVSLFPLWCKGGKHRRGVPRHQAKVTISVQRDQDQQSGRMEVTVEPKTASSPVPLAAEDQL